MTRTWAICLKEFRHIRRDPRILFLVLLSPAIMLVAFAYLFSLEVQHLHLAVLDYDHTRLSRQFVATLTGDGELQVVATPRDYSQIYDLLLRGTVDVALVLPTGMEADLLRGVQVPVQAIVDGSDPISAGQNVGNLSVRTAAFSMDLLLAGRAIPAAPVEMRTQSWYNPELKSLVSMVPGLLAIVLIVPGLAIAIAITREKETGSFESLVSTPVQGAEYILGKLAAYTVYSLLSGLLVFAITVLWFQVPFWGDPGLLILLTLDYLIATMGFSILIATFVGSQQAAMLIVLLIFFVPSFFLTGLITPVNPESPGAQMIAMVLPATHYVTISRGLFLKGVGLADLQGPALSLAVMGLGSLGLSIRVFRKEAA